MRSATSSTRAGWRRAALRVTFWSALAMTLTAGIGKLFGTVI
jgi:VIT1/CCC1 family predicted Fe2+/Mn2+ transporter